MGCEDPSNNINDAMKDCKGNTYAPVPVTILKISGSTVEFSAPGGTFKATWGSVDDMWTPCPSTLKSAATVKNLTGPTTVKASGTLYLSAVFLKNNNIPSAEPKWPTRYGTTTPVAPLVIAPTSIVVTATELNDDNFFSGSIDLMNPDLAQVPQSIDTSGGPITVQLTEAGFTLFHAVVDPSSQLDAALAAINAQQDVFTIARGWQVIATVVKQLSMSGNKMVITPAQRAGMAKLVPGVELPSP